MSHPLAALVRPLALKDTLYPPTSRYHGLATATLETSGGKTIVHLRRRFISQPDQFATLQEHTVTEGDRLDNLAAKYLGDPEQAWRLCDANVATRPEELTETPGRKLRITLPEGIPGAGGA